MQTTTTVLGLDLGRSAVHGVLVDGSGVVIAADVHFLDFDDTPLPTPWLHRLLAGRRPVRIAVATSRFDDPALLPRARVLLIRLGRAPRLPVHGSTGIETIELELPLEVTDPEPVLRAVARASPLEAVVLLAGEGADGSAAVETLAGRLRPHLAVPLLTAAAFEAAYMGARARLGALLHAARLVRPVAELIDAVQVVLGELGIEAPLGLVGGDGGLHAPDEVRAVPQRLVFGASAAALLAAATGGLTDHLLVDGGGVDGRLLFRDDGRPRRCAEGAPWDGLPLGIESMDVVRLPPGGDRPVRVRRGGLHVHGPPVLPLARLGAEPALAQQLRARAGARGWVLVPGTPPRLRAASSPARERARPVGWTLGDAARLMGRTALGSEWAARLGAERLARAWADGRGGPPELFARRVLDAVEGELAAALVEAALARDGEDPTWFRRARRGPTVASALAPTGGPLGRPLVTAIFRLMRPLVICGGFAPAVLERPAIHLDTARVLPARPELLGAFGTLLARPRAVAAHILADGEDEARIRAQLTDRVRARLAAAGAARPEIGLERVMPAGGGKLVLRAVGEGTVEPMPPIDPDWR